jgi:A/G-specific adenine glycosylase
MDYGVMLKKTVGNFSRQSSHYAKQSRFVGSDRQIRGMILQVVLEQPGLDEHGIIIEIGEDPDRIKRIIKDLEQERFIFCNHGGWAVVR